MYFQVLVATKRKKTLGYLIGTAAMLVAFGVVLTLIIVLSGGDNGTAQPIESTERPTTPVVPVDPTTPTTTTTAAPTTEPVVTDPPPAPLDLEEIIDGVYSPPSFNATWSTGMFVETLVIIRLRSHMLCFTPKSANDFTCFAWNAQGT